VFVFYTANIVDLDLFYPVSNKQVGISSSAVISVRSKNNFLAIWAKHRESIKAFVYTDFFKALSF